MELCRWCAWAGEICSNSCLLAGGTKLDKEPARPAVSLAFPSSRFADVANVSPCRNQAINQSIGLRHWRPAARLPTRPFEAAVDNNFVHGLTVRVASLTQFLLRFHKPPAQRHAPSLSSIISWSLFNHHTTCHPPHPWAPTSLPCSPYCPFQPSLSFSFGTTCLYGRLLHIS